MIKIKQVVNLKETIEQSEENAKQYSINNFEPIITKKSAFNKDFGTTSGTIAEGNHTHSYNALTDKPSSLPANGGNADTVANKSVNDSSTSVDSLWTANKINTELSNKVDKVSGKALSTNDFTNDYKTKLDGLNNYSHPTGDGNLHVPATGTTNANKVLMAGSTAGSATWTGLTPSHITTNTSNQFVSDTEKSTWNSKAEGNHTHSYAGSASVGGSANSAVKLATARTINGVSFDGTSSITITADPNTHNQASNTINAMSGYAKPTTTSAIETTDSLNTAIGKLEKSVEVHTHNYAGSSSAGGAATTALACTGNSATATKLATARTINGTSFDGSANITITADPNAHNQASSTITAMTGYSKPTSTSAITTTDSLNTAIGKLETKADTHTHSYAGSSSAGGSATSAVKLATARTINGVSFDGSANITITADPNSHNQASSTINAMTGYSKASAVSAISTTDSLNTAIGKLEKALDSKQASGSYASSTHTHNYAGSASAGGSATSAVKLETARTINGVSFDGTANITITADPNSHNQASNTINAMTGYTKPSTTSAITTTDTLNSAIGKLEKSVETHTHAYRADTWVPTWSDVTNKPDLETLSGSQSKADTALSSAKAYTDEKVAEIVDSAPEALDTLMELSNALGNDPNFATTVSTQIGTKADKTYVDTQLATKAASSHNQASSTITAMTGYSKASAVSAIATSDSLNTAIGKLEKALDSKQASGSYAAESHTHNYAGSSSVGGAATSALTCTGNSATATKLATARTINGVSFDGSANITITADPNSHNQASSTITALTGYTKASAVSALATTDSLNTALGKLEKALDSKQASGSYASSTHTHNYAGSSSVGGAATTALACTGNSATATKLASAVTINGTSFDGSSSITITATPNSHNQASNTINAMTDYAKPTSYSAITTTDTLNSAIGKLEKALDSKQASGSYAAESHTHSYAGSSSVGGSANSAVKLATARTINGVSFDGTANITITATPNAHNQDASTINSLSDYVKATTVSAIATTDTLSTALGKLEKALDSKQASGSYAASSHTHNYAGSSSAGGAATTALACTGNSATATKLATARTINGVSFDGSANITVTADPNAHNQASSTITVLTGYSKSGSTATALGTADTLNTALAKLENLLDTKSSTSHTHSYAGSSSVGGAATSALACTGNSATATTLATARTINGTSFNGSANITTAQWGTARTLTIGNSGKSVNGSANISWTLSEIGAVATASQACGSSIFNSSEGVTISIGKTMSAATYKVSVTPTSDPEGTLGEIWIESKTTTSFVVKCSGSTTTTTFDWMVMI